MFFVLMMVASYLDSHPSSPASLSTKGEIIKFGSADKLIRMLQCGLALSCLTICILFVPEDPTELASICQRHHSVDACQVW